MFPQHVDGYDRSVIKRDFSYSVSREMIEEFRMPEQNPFSFLKAFDAWFEWWLLVEVHGVNPGFLNIHIFNKRMQGKCEFESLWTGGWRA